MKFKIKYLLTFVFLMLIVGVNNISAVKLTSNELGSYLDEKTGNSASSAYVIGQYIFTDSMAMGTDDIMLAARSIAIEDTGKTNKDAIFKKMQIMEMVFNLDTNEWELKEYFKGKDIITEYDIKYIDYEEMKEEVLETYDVVFVTDNSRDSKNVESGKLVEEPPKPEKADYKFEGWYLEDELFDFNTPITSDIELTAKFTKVTCHVSFEGMDNLDDFSEKSLTCGEKITDLATATSTSKGDFVNWYLNGEEFNLDTPINEDIVLVARFKSDFVHTVTFYDGSKEFTDLMQEVYEGDTATKPESPTKEGYTFIDWYTSKDNLFDFTSKIMYDIKLYAKWDKNVAKVTDEESLLEALQNKEIGFVELDSNITLTNPLSITRGIEIIGNGNSLKADYTSDNGTFITISGDLEVTMDNVIIDANEKGRGLKVSDSKLIFKNSTVKNGKSTSYVGGIFVTEEGNLEFINSILTDNENSSSYSGDNYINYAKDLWIGSEASATITSGTIGNMFVNGNEYGSGSVIVNGGNITNLYLEFDKDNGATVTYNDGVISNILKATAADGVYEEINSPAKGTYTSVK